MKEAIDVAALFPEIELIEDSGIRDGVREVWQRCWDESAFERIEDVPVTPSLAYSHVIHNRSVVQMAISVAQIVETFHGAKVNHDHLIAAALLQDVSKLVEYKPGTSGEKPGHSKRGETFQHGFWGAHIALEVGLPEEVAQSILYHTFEGGKYPPNLITKILFYVDQVDMAALGGDRWKKLGVVYR